MFKIQVKTAVRESLAENKSVIDTIIPQNSPMPDVRDSHAVGDAADKVIEQSNVKLSQLVDDSFPFDESQLESIRGMVRNQFACMTGAAGTGKTTTTKKLVDTLLRTSRINEVDLESYHKSVADAATDDDEYEAPTRWVPSVAIVGFTGKSTQAIKKNFPRDWHGNIMTIHRCLGFRPVTVEDMGMNEETGLIEQRRVRRFMPSYDADCLLPWDILIVDEAGMLGLTLWHQLFAALKPSCRVYMIGDINQLPPVQDRSIFGFAMSKWPTYELTHVHRQKGDNNAIVDNAWRILKGQMPKSENNFQMIECKGDAGHVNRMARAIMPKLWKEKKVFEPNRDMLIVPINGELGARGYLLGQLTLNEQLANIFNAVDDDHRFFIDAGRERKTFAIGDKVMATKNDYGINVTNGMTGVIVDIKPNGSYAGDTKRFGSARQVREYLASTGEDEDETPFDLEAMSESFAKQLEGKEDAKEQADRGPASHIVTVNFGSDEHPHEVNFATLSEVASLMIAYAATCHKMQGAECPTIVILIHDVHKASLYREWLYTAVTRASGLCILMYTKDALRATLGKQTVKGKNLQEKIESFASLAKVNTLTGRAAVGIKIGQATQLEINEDELTRLLGSGNPDRIVQPDSGDTDRSMDGESGNNRGHAQTLRIPNRADAEPARPESRECSTGTTPVGDRGVPQIRVQAKAAESTASSDRPSLNLAPARKAIPQFTIKKV